MYDEAYMICRNIEEVMDMFSEKESITRGGDPKGDHGGISSLGGRSKKIF